MEKAQLLKVCCAALHLNLQQTGWHEGIRGMCLGEKRELIIPPEKAYPQIIYYVKCFDASRYGSLGVKGRIPPHATLTFEVELVSFDEPPPASFWER